MDIKIKNGQHTCGTSDRFGSIIANKHAAVKTHAPTIEFTCENILIKSGARKSSLLTSIF